MGTLTKRLARKPLVQRVLAAAAAGLMGLVKTTTRWTAINDAVAAPAWAGEKPVIVAFWHNRLAMMPACWPSRAPFHMLISSHPDGRLVANTIAHFGFNTVAGSSTRGGGEALRTMVRLVKDGASIGVTPDGPRGPRMRAGEGVLMLARLTGAVIIPLSVSVSRRRVLGTWDQLIIPLPFGRGAMVWGDPINVPREAGESDLAYLRQKLEDDLLRVSAEADALVGHDAMTQGDHMREKANARA
jgi:lysophospholipid acyltransferase (LPLAT)-like uncharacterized protein